jgi:hypothetical protein
MLPVMTADRQATIVTFDADHCIATYNGTFVQIWRASTTSRAVSGLRSAARAHAARWPGPISAVILIEQAASLPDGDMRKQVAAFWSDLGARLLCTAVVQEGDGFRAAAVRGLMTGLMLLSRPTSPYKIFRTIGEASAWVVPQLEKAGERGSSDLAKTLEALRQRTHGRAPTS